MAVKVYMSPNPIKYLVYYHAASIRVYSNHWGSPLLSRTMSSKSHPKDTKHPRFGHLPLSTSGPEKCALTVMQGPTTTFLGLGLTNCRVHHCCALHIIIKDPHFLRMSVRISSFMVYYLQMCRHWMNKLNGHTSSIANAEMPSPRIPS